MPWRKEKWIVFQLPAIVLPTDDSCCDFVVCACPRYSKFVLEKRAARLSEFLPLFRIIKRVHVGI